MDSAGIVRDAPARAQHESIHARDGTGVTDAAAGCQGDAVAARGGDFSGVGDGPCGAGSTVDAVR